MQRAILCLTRTTRHLTLGSPPANITPTHSVYTQSMAVTLQVTAPACVAAVTQTHSAVHGALLSVVGITDILTARAHPASVAVDTPGCRVGVVTGALAVTVWAPGAVWQIAGVQQGVNVTVSISNAGPATVACALV